MRRKIAGKKKVKVRRGRPRRRASSSRGRLSRKIFLPERIKELIEKSKHRGFVTSAEILNYFPEMEKDIKGLELLYESLDKEGIEVKETREFLKVEEKS